MIAILLLVASMANAQVGSTAAEPPVNDQLKISNMGKAIRDLESGRYRQTGKPTFANGICFGDGTCLTTGTGVTPNVALSSGTSTNTSGTVWGCVSGSTMTITVGQDARVRAEWSSSSQISVQYAFTYFDILLDGANMGDSTEGLQRTGNHFVGSGNPEIPFHPYAISAPLSAGSHTICAAWKVGSGTATTGTSWQASVSEVH